MSKTCFSNENKETESPPSTCRRAGRGLDSQSVIRSAYRELNVLVVDALRAIRSIKERQIEKISDISRLMYKSPATYSLSELWLQ